MQLGNGRRAIERALPDPKNGIAAVRELKAAGVPRARVQKLVRQLGIELVFTAHPTESKRRTMLEKLATLGFNPVANTPDEWQARIKLEIEKWGKVVKDAGLKIE